MSSATAASRPAIGEVSQVSSGTLISESATPKARAVGGAMRPAGSGRVRVRSMCRSVSRSK